MPEIPIHEEVAYKIAQKYKYLDTPNYYLGALTPDAINYQGFAEKEKRWEAHLRDSDLDKWQENILKFYDQEKSNYNKEFLLGYVIHITTDIVFDRDFYLKIRKTMLGDSIPLDKTHNLMRQEMLNYANTSKEWQIVKENLKSINKYYSIRNISAKMLNEWVLIQQQRILPTEKSKYITDTIIDELTTSVINELKNIIN